MQIRLADGNVVFTPGLFGPGINVTDVVYQMESLDAGVKHRGFALEGEYYWRRLSNFRGAGIGALPFDHLTDTGFQLQASAMVAPKTAQLYLSGSKIFGNYGKPSDVRFGVNVFPWKNQVIRPAIEHGLHRNGEQREARKTCYTDASLPCAPVAQLDRAPAF